MTFFSVREADVRQIFENVGIIDGHLRRHLNEHACICRRSFQPKKFNGAFERWANERHSLLLGRLAHRRTHRVRLPCIRDARSATLDGFGVTSLKSSTRLLQIDISKCGLKPVIFPPGRARLGTIPDPHDDGGRWFQVFAMRNKRPSEDGGRDRKIVPVRTPPFVLTPKTAASSLARGCWRMNRPPRRARSILAPPPNAKGEYAKTVRIPGVKPSRLCEINREKLEDAPTLC
jgi:hypothetical protein